jgi:hypothetical protein
VRRAGTPLAARLTRSPAQLAEHARWELNADAREYLANGTPESRLIKAVPAGGIVLEELKACLPAATRPRSGVALRSRAARRPRRHAPRRCDACVPALTLARYRRRLGRCLRMLASSKRWR